MQQTFICQQICHSVRRIRGRRAELAEPKRTLLNVCKGSKAEGKLWGMHYWAQWLMRPVAVVNCGKPVSHPRVGAQAVTACPGVHPQSNR